LGEGAFGDVVLATEKKTGRQFAVKKMLKVHLSKESNKKFVMNERNVLQKCNHPNIVKLYSAFRDDEFFYYVLNLAPNGEIHGQIRKNKGLHLDCVRFWTAETVLALEYLHTQIGVIHRDLKPENLLLDANWHILLTDFGTANIAGTAEGVLARKGSFVGTIEYMPPELVKDTSSCFASDLWSLGCTVYQMITSKPPFRALTEYLTMNKIQEGFNAISFPEPFPEVARDLIEKLMKTNPHERLGAKTYAQLKAHPFFTGIDWVNIHNIKPPTSQPPSTKMMWKEDILKEEEERIAKEKQELRDKWATFLQNSENIVEHGNVIKQRGFSRKKRMLILTDYPRFMYIDQRRMELKGEILFDSTLRIELRNDIAWRIITPKRIYELEDIGKDSARWSDAVEKLKQKEKS